MTTDIKVSKAEIVAMLYLLQDAASGWGEPFKDLDIDRYNLEWSDVDKAVASLILKLKSASKELEK